MIRAHVAMEGTAARYAVHEEVEQDGTLRVWFTMDPPPAGISREIYSYRGSRRALAAPLQQEER